MDNPRQETANWYSDNYDSWKKRIMAAYPSNSYDMWRGDAEECDLDVRKEYKKLKNHTPFEVMIMEYLPLWRKLSGLPDKVDLMQELQEMDKELKSFIRSASFMREKIHEILKKKE